METIKTKKDFKKVVVTGSTGTIGVALVNYLTSKNIKCVLINIPEFVTKNVYNNLELITFIDGSLEDYLELMKKNDLPRDCDGFIHLAWAGSFGPRRDNVALQIKNIQGTMEAITLAKEMGCKAFVGAGSQAEYGKGVEEISHIVNPINVYGVAKFSAGQLGKILSKQIGIRFNWVRIFSVFGPNLPSGSLVQYVVSSLLDGVSPRLTKCEQMWDFLYTEDAAEALFAVLSNGVDGKVYELGSGMTGTIRSFLETIPNLLNVSANIDFGAIPYPENQIMNMCADVSELKKDTSWTPKHTFSDGVLAIAKSIQNNKEQKGD